MLPQVTLSTASVREALAYSERKSFVPRLIALRARFFLGLYLSDDTIQETKVAGEGCMSDFQQNPVLDRDGLRQIKRHLACLAEELAPGTIKNRMTTLRWVDQKIGKDNIVALE